MQTTTVDYNDPDLRLAIPPKRNPHACDYCRKRKRRCEDGGPGRRCKACTEHDRECCYTDAKATSPTTSTAAASSPSSSPSPSLGQAQATSSQVNTTSMFSTSSMHTTNAQVNAPMFSTSSMHSPHVYDVSHPFANPTTMHAQPAPPSTAALSLNQYPVSPRAYMSVQDTMDHRYHRAIVPQHAHSSDFALPTHRHQFLQLHTRSPSEPARTPSLPSQLPSHMIAQSSLAGALAHPPSLQHGNGRYGHVNAQMSSPTDPSPYHDGAFSVSRGPYAAVNTEHLAFANMEYTPYGAAHVDRAHPTGMYPVEGALGTANFASNSSNEALLPNERATKYPYTQNANYYGHTRDPSQ